MTKNSITGDPTDAAKAVMSQENNSQCPKQGYDSPEVPNLMTSPIYVHVQVSHLIAWLEILFEINQIFAICKFTTPYKQRVFTPFYGINFSHFCYLHKQLILKVAYFVYIHIMLGVETQVAKRKIADSTEKKRVKPFTGLNFCAMGNLIQQDQIGTATLLLLATAAGYQIGPPQIWLIQMYFKLYNLYFERSKCKLTEKRIEYLKQ